MEDLEKKIKEYALKLSGLRLDLIGKKKNIINLKRFMCTT